MNGIIPTRLKYLMATNGIFVAAVVLAIFFTANNPRFLTVGNGVNIVGQIAELGLLVMPVALLVISGGIDLSVGSVASLSAVVGAMTMSSLDSTSIGILAAIGVGAVAGAINGLLVGYLNLNSIVVTLGFLSVWGGLALLLTGGRTVTRSEIPQSFHDIGNLSIGPISLRVVLAVCAIAFTWYLLNKTRAGREIYAVGGNAHAAHLMGVNVARVRFMLYLASGTGAAAAGLMLASKIQSVSPSIGQSMEMDALTVVLLGGVAFMGGIGRVGGVIAGLLFYGILRNGLVFMQASPFLQTIIVGLTLVVAVAMDSSIQRFLKKSWGEAGKRAITEESHNDDSAESDQRTAQKVG